MLLITGLGIQCGREAEISTRIHFRLPAVLKSARISSCQLALVKVERYADIDYCLAGAGYLINHTRDWSADVCGNLSDWYRRSRVCTIGTRPCIPK
ncbi:hypothetical protein PTI98_003698 [Pleurotus ostreatus]|nr:hypothetical protein PTI98_003698 [Pleurotus ostreatus]